MDQRTLAPRTPAPLRSDVYLTAEIIPRELSRSTAEHSLVREVERWSLNDTVELEQFSPKPCFCGRGFPKAQLAAKLLTIVRLASFIRTLSP